MQFANTKNVGALRHIPWVSILSALVLGLSSLSLSAETTSSSRQLEGSLTTTFGTTLDPENSQASVTFEPSAKWNFSKNTALLAYAEIDRPFDQYENFTNPKSYFLLTHKVDWLGDWKTTLRYTLRGNNIHRWSDDGYQIRNQAGIQVNKEIATNLTFMARTSVSADINQYDQTTAGKDLQRLGFIERVALVYAPKPFSFELHLIVAQSYHGSAGGRALWKNGYVTAQVAEYLIDDRFTVGLTHELLSSVIDESTGSRRSLRVFDGRESRLSAYLDVSL